MMEMYILYVVAVAVSVLLGLIFIEGKESKEKGSRQSSDLPKDEQERKQ